MRVETTLLFGLALVGLASIVSGGQPSAMHITGASEGVRTELARIQGQTGLTLAYINGSVNMVDFSDRSVRDITLNPSRRYGVLAPSGTSIAFGIYGGTAGTTFGVSRLDGTDLHEFVTADGPNIICFSPGNDSFALSTQKPDTIQILELKLKSIQSVAADAQLTEQCWQPDGKKIVYEAKGSIAVLNLETRTTEILAQGSDASWSPDGSWIAFRDKDSYYAIRPSTKEKKLLFKSKGTLSGLWWSPDSKVVAYLTRASFSEGSWKSVDIEPVRLRVRRLSDNSEDWVSDLSQAYLPRYQWVQNAELFHNARHTP